MELAKEIARDMACLQSMVFSLQEHGWLPAKMLVNTFFRPVMHSSLTSTEFVLV
jgi:hypothetical protein